MLLYIIFMAPALILTLWAQAKVKGTYKKYSQVPASVSGAQAARRVLDAEGLQGVAIEAIQGELTDHYDPRHRVLRLSQGVYGVPTISAIGIAAHEAGHAIQHARGYAPLKVRTTIVPAVNIGSRLGLGILLIGFLMNNPTMAWIGVILFSLTTIFTLVTLPVEFDASRRAKEALVQVGLVDGGVRGGQDSQGVSAVLSAAAWTYVAAFVSSLLTLLYYISLLSGRRG
jgi:uncharacterized protein